MLRIAAVGDLHYGLAQRNQYRADFARLKDEADLLLLAGDVTQSGKSEEAELLAQDLCDIGIPIVAVLGNHDYHRDQHGLIRAIMEKCGITVLEGETQTIKVAGVTIGIAGMKGFVGGYRGTELYEFGEPEMRNFAAQAREQAVIFKQKLHDLIADIKIALLHYSPIAETVEGEHPALHPFMGSYYFGEAIDAAGADIAFHGHAHAGQPAGTTANGTPVWNVAQPVIGQTYKVFTL